MATKDTMDGKLAFRMAKVRDELDRTGKLVLRAPALVHFCECSMRFLLGALLPGAQLFGGYAPFGVGLVACSGSGLEGFCALLGACLGYFSFHGFVEGLRYVAAAILVYSVSFAFYDLRLYRLTWFMPVLASFMMMASGFVYLSEGGWSQQGVVYFLTEVLLTGGSCYFYTIAFSSWGKGGRDEATTHKQRIAILLLVGTLLLTLVQLTFFNSLSVGRILAVMGVISAAYLGGMGLGAVAGVALGVGLDLTVEGYTIYAMSMALSGVMAGIAHGKGKLSCAISYVLANGFVVLWMWNTGPHISLLYEVFMASVLFLLLPQSLLSLVQSFFKSKEADPLYVKSTAFIKDRLSATADSFRGLHLALLTAFTNPPPNDNDMATLFDRAAQRVCKSCTLQSRCWHANYISTYNALNDALPAMVERGKGQVEDFPQWFSSGCTKFSEFLAASNQELTALRYRRQYHHHLQESRKAVCSQYGTLADTLSQAVSQLEQGLIPDPVATKRLGQYLLSRGMEGESGVYFANNGHIRVEIATSRMGRLNGSDLCATLSQVVGKPLRLVKEDPHRGNRLLLVEEEPLVAVAGLAAETSEGQSVSGDTGTWFKGEDGTLYVLLCDGMGSGTHARKESDMAVQLLEKFLRAGVCPHHAMKTVGVALGLRGESQGNFTTVDLLAVNLFTGEGGIYKYGSAPTYLKQENQVARIAGTTLPMGATTQGSDPDFTPFSLGDGDTILLMSDGITGGGSDLWVREAFGEFDGDSPKDLACALIRERSANGVEDADDCTALVLKINRRTSSSIGVAKSAQLV